MMGINFVIKKKNESQQHGQNRTHVKLVTDYCTTCRGTHVPLGRRGAEEVYEVLPFDRVGSFLDGLQKKRKERIRPVGLVKVQIAQDGERDNPL